MILLAWEPWFVAMKGRVEDAGERHHGLHMVPELLIQVNVQYLGSSHGIGHVHIVDVLYTKHNVARVRL
jgi:hypothetical protein